MANEMQKTTPFGMRDKVGYMFGDFANDFTFILSSSFLMKFYTDVMGVSAGVVGMIMMIARFVDAFTDVTMGQIVDRSKPTRDGKFRPWLKRMCGPVAIASFLIFQSGLAGMSYGFKVAWLFLTYILWGSIFYTSVNIPYGSMASAISADPKDRAELSTWRTIGSTLAGLVIGVGTPMVAYVTVNGQTVLSGSRMTIIAGVFSVCAILCYLLCFHLVRERVDVPANNSIYTCRLHVEANKDCVGKRLNLAHHGGFDIISTTTTGLLPISLRTHCSNVRSQALMVWAVFPRYERLVESSNGSPPAMLCLRAVVAV